MSFWWVKALSAFSLLGQLCMADKICPRFQSQNRLVLSLNHMILYHMYQFFFSY